MTETEQFCRILRERSVENISSGQLLFNNRLYGQLISVLRQELDSLVRSVFLLSKDINTIRKDSLFICQLSRKLVLRLF